MHAFFVVCLQWNSRCCRCVRARLNVGYVFHGTEIVRRQRSGFSFPCVAFVVRHHPNPVLVASKRNRCNLHQYEPALSSWRYEVASGSGALKRHVFTHSTHVTPRLPTPTLQRYVLTRLRHPLGLRRPLSCLLHTPWHRPPGTRRC